MRSYPVGGFEHFEVEANGEEVYGELSAGAYDRITNGMVLISGHDPSSGFHFATRTRKGGKATMRNRDRNLETAKHDQSLTEQPSAISLPDVPRFDEGEASPLPRLKENVKRMGGKLAELEAGTDLTAWVAENYPEAKVVCSATPEVGGNRELSDLTAPQSLEDVDLGIARAVFGVAETGSVYLSNRELTVNALGYLSQHLLVLLDPADIVGSLHHAFARPEFAEARYSVLMTGPSATADIEGVLIHGAQGVRSLTVALMAKPAGDASA